MLSAAIAHSLRTGLDHHRAGRLAQAEAIYKQVLASDPNQPEALNLLGVIFNGKSQHQSAIILIRRALEQKPNWPEAWHNFGNAARDAGQSAEAVAAYRQALAYNPQFADSCINLGNLLIERNAFDEAVGLFERAIQLRPNDAQAHSNLGNALVGKEDFDAAVAAYQRAVAIQPGFFQAWSNLGIALKEKGEWDESIRLHEKAIALRPNYPQAHRNLGDTLKLQKQHSAAIAAYRRAIALKPGYADAYKGLGDALRDSGQLSEAIEAYQSAIVTKPNSAELYTILGNLLKLTGKFVESLAVHKKALSINPEFAEAHSNLGSVLKDGWRIDEAIAACQRAIELKPDFANAYGNLGHALLLGGQLDDAMAAMRRVIELQPDDADAHGGYVFSLHYHPDFDSAAIADAHAEWNRRHAEPLRKHILVHTNKPDPDRPLRIGYVSADFWAHPVGRFLLPLLTHHDRNRVEIYAYSQATVVDEMTQEFKKRTAVWIDCVGLTDSQMADRIRRDMIDILVDLSLHTAGNRLLVFAQKPAPVQITWLGYPGSTGLKTIDYRISDPYLDPAGVDESVYSEKTLRLANTYWCYQPSPVAPDPGPLPADRQNHIVFGCLNHFGKVSQPILRAWIKILQVTPDAVLLMHVPSGSARQRVLDQFANEGIDSKRIEFAERTSPAEYFKLYGRIDIALDTSPFAGGTTTCDALWMGVPVVTLKGKTVTGRGGFSILSNVGLAELVAETEEKYIDIAIALAADRQRLAALRSGLRQKMLQSPLMDAPAFAREMESAYRVAWRAWCSKSS